MNILAVDDEKLALEVLVNAIAETAPDANIYSFRKPSEAMELAADVPCDIAFLDIKMRGMTGLELAKKLKDINGKVNIIFVTGYSEYSLDAFRLYASDYLLKPVDVQQVKSAMENLRYPVKHITKKKLQIQCFGNFEVFSNGVPLYFNRNKTKELLAYLTDRKGASCTMGELTAILWENKPDSISQRSNLRNLIHDLKNTLASVDADDIILKNRNTISLKADAVECDYFDFLCGTTSAVNLYHGEYMLQYSWAEMTTATLSNT
ncbi:MAG: response regulator [Acutalibacteraceae bacterium]